MAVEREAVARMFAKMNQQSNPFRKVSPMSEEQLPLFGHALTEPSRDTPPMVGWWNVRRISHQGRAFTMRRWWDGNDWSYPVEIGGTYTPNALENLRNTKATFPNEAYEWQGAVVPLADYPYLLHAQSDAEALTDDADMLASQAAVITAAFHTEPAPSAEIVERRRSF